MDFIYSGVLSNIDGDWLVEFPSIPGAFGGGKTKSQACRNAAEALRLALASEISAGNRPPGRMRLGRRAPVRRRGVWRLRRGHGSDDDYPGGRSARRFGRARLPARLPRAARLRRPRRQAPRYMRKRVSARLGRPPGAPPAHRPPVNLPRDVLKLRHVRRAGVGIQARGTLRLAAGRGEA